MMRPSACTSQRLCSWRDCGLPQKRSPWKQYRVKIRVACQTSHAQGAAPVEGTVTEPPAPAPLPDDELFFDVPSHVEERNRQFREELRGGLILAPLTRGGNLPFRQLCVEYGADATMSEMAYARQLIKGDRVERARLYKAANETCFGFQVATKAIDHGIAAAKMAEAAGARWLDINCGCPIYEASRRGLGAIQLSRPTKLVKMVAGIVAASPLPVTVKIRIGENKNRINAARVAELLERTGAAAVIIHGRTMEQGYRRPADWDLISSVAASRALPVIGNGDVYTYYEAQRRAGAVHALLLARGALIKPWIFAEIKQGRELLLDARDRVGVYRQLVSHMKAHFGPDAMGRRKAFYFFPWHFKFFCRYRHLPASSFEAKSLEAPLLNTRMGLVEEGEDEASLPLLERLLRCESEDAHAAMSAALWDSATDDEAMATLTRLADTEVLKWEQEWRTARENDTRDGEERSEG